MSLHREVLARAKRATDACHREHHLLAREIEDARELLLIDVQPLGRYVEVDSPLAIRNRKPGFRTKGRLVLHSDLVLAAHDDVCAWIRVPVADLHVASHVAAWVQLRRVRRKGVLGLRQRTQNVVFDPHLLRCPPRLLGVVGGDERDRLAPVADEVESEHRLVLDLEAVELLAGHVLVSQHGFHARHRACLRGVDRHEARIRVWAAHRRAPEHALGMKVRRVGEGAADLGRAVGAADAFADPHRAARFTASMIFW